uniref:Uncharacterized protein n=1 Tax=Rhizophora mucronata TaxID=61149 RepID=A0A2P2JLM3_RHIMU
MLALYPHYNLWFNTSRSNVLKAGNQV